jgi:hypothetical protein
MTRATTCRCDACKAIPQDQFMSGVLGQVSIRRNQARKRQEFEFAETMPIDDLISSDELGLDATFCQDLD